MHQISYAMPAQRYLSVDRDQAVMQDAACFGVAIHHRWMSLSGWKERRM